MVDFPETLISQIARRKAIVVIGSGVSAQARVGDTDQRPKTWGSFLSHAMSKVDRPQPYLKNALKEFRYLDACYYLKEELGEEWLELVTSEYGTPNFQPSGVHRAIQNLDCRIVLSLNFDQIYDRSCQQGTEGTYYVKNYYDEHLRRCLVGHENYILKLHGSVDSPEKLIFDSEDYASARTKYWYFYDVVRALAMTNTLLFIGCGTSDPDVKSMLEDHRYSTDTTPHYFLTGDKIVKAEADLLKKTRGLNIIRYNSQDNHAELSQQLENLVEKVTEERSKISMNMNW
jgi:hypothetical protein